MRIAMRGALFHVDCEKTSQTVNRRTRQRPDRTPLAARLLLPVAALVMLAGQAGADTLRTALYEFEIADPALRQTQPDPQVYMRVSNADRLTTNPADPLGPPSSARAKSGFALFEFFLGPQGAGFSLSKVRFQQPRTALGRLHTILCADESESPESTSALRGPPEPANTFTVDFQRPGRPTGVRPREVVGLLFELAPSESIDTLIDERLERGDLRPEVEVRFPGGASRWATCTRRVYLRDGDPQPPGNLTARNAYLIASISPVVTHATTEKPTSLPPNDAKGRSAEPFMRTVPKRVPPGLGARAPPLCAA